MMGRRSVGGPTEDEMQYLCVQCDKTFDSDDSKPRCPTCMRVNGIRAVGSEDGKVAQGGSAAGGHRAAQLGAVGAVLLALSGLAYMALRTEGADEDAEATATALADRGIDSAELGALFDVDDGLRALSSQVRGKSPKAAAEAVNAQLRARAKALSFVPWSMVDPRGEPPMTAAETWAALAEDGARRNLYPLEVAVTAVAALREAGVEAAVVEIKAFPGDRSPVDPSGCLGYFGFGVREADGTLAVFDPYGGRSQAPTADAVTVLGEAQVLAAALGARALHGVAWASSPGPALSDIEAALSLHPEAPYLRSTHAVVLADGGGIVEAERALEAAAALRGDAPRKNNLAVYRLQRGDVEAAGGLVTAALSEQPDYAAARVTLAGVLMAKLDNDQAFAELKKAEAVDPELPTLPLAWAQYHAGTGDMDAAIRFAEQGAALRPKSPHLQLSLGRLYKMAGRYGDMQRAAKRALEVAADARKRDVRQLIELMLGPTALQDDDADEGVAPPSGSENGPNDSAQPADTLPGLGDDLDVTRGSRFLGDSDG